MEENSEICDNRAQIQRTCRRHCHLPFHLFFQSNVWEIPLCLEREEKREWELVTERERDRKGGGREGKGRRGLENRREGKGRMQEWREGERKGGNWFSGTFPVTSFFPPTETEHSRVVGKMPTPRPPPGFLKKRCLEQGLESQTLI